VFLGGKCGCIDEKKKGGREIDKEGDDDPEIL
jgi:hypothetical protein